MTETRTIYLERHEEADEGWWPTGEKVEWEAPTRPLLAVADLIEHNPARYHQWSWSAPSDCGTAYCIAGWAAVATGLAIEDDRESNLWAALDDGKAVCAGPIFELAPTLLDLPRHVAERLVDGSWHPADDLTVPEALRALDAVQQATGTITLRDVYAVEGRLGAPRLPAMVPDLRAEFAAAREVERV